MKTLLFIVLVCLIGYQLFSPGTPRLRPESDGPYIVVYGRDACSITRDFKEGLNNADVPFSYRLIDEKSVQDHLYPRMERAGLNVSGYGLPVVEVNGQIFTQPELQDVLKIYGARTKGPLVRRSAGICAAGAPGAAEAASVELFEISGIILGKPSMAIIGGSALKVGDKIGEYKISEIGKDYVRFLDPRGNAITQRLELAETGPAGAIR